MSCDRRKRVGGGGELACLIGWEGGETVCFFAEFGERGLKRGLLNDQLKNEQRSDVF